MLSIKPSFLITIDTEGDNLWANPKVITTENAIFLPRFQSLCERYGFKPTWLTNYEMAIDERFAEFATDAVGRGQAEIGTHVHAWNSPPLIPVGHGAPGAHAYLIEFTESVMRDKFRFVDDLLSEKFDRKMVSHRAGRWAFDERYLSLLEEFGYLVDCSVTPGYSWAQTLGASSGGADYTDFPSLPYRMSHDDISKLGQSTVIQAPMTIVPTASLKLTRLVGRDSFLSRVVRKLMQPDLIWLRPNGRNIKYMKRIIDRCVEENRPYAMFMLHSSELMPGGSPTFRDEESIERLYDHLNELFEYASKSFSGSTMEEYCEVFLSGEVPTGSIDTPTQTSD